MTVTLHPPPDIEAGLLAEARARGVSLDTLLETLVRNFAQTSRQPPSAAAHMLQMEDGICALQVGRRISINDVNGALEALRLERDLLNLGAGH